MRILYFQKELGIAQLKLVTISQKSACDFLTKNVYPFLWVQMDVLKTSLTVAMGSVYRVWAYVIQSTSVVMELMRSNGRFPIHPSIPFIITIDRDYCQSFRY